METKRKTSINHLLSLKQRKEKISMLTAYDFCFAQILDEAGIDIVLVGDSLGNVMLGYENTLPVTMPEMIMHTQAVSRGVNHALVVSDLPFGSYQKSKEDALSSAIDLVKAGANAVKLEGAQYVDAIKEIVKAGIPVMGHLGFTPQSVNALGYKVQGKSEEEKKKLIEDAKSLEKAGCFAVVLELVPSDLAKAITESVNIPTIGIGAGRECDGQVLVTYDMLGLYPNPPSFVKKYASLRDDITHALKSFVKDL